MVIASTTPQAAHLNIACLRGKKAGGKRERTEKKEKKGKKTSKKIIAVQRESAKEGTRGVISAYLLGGVTLKILRQ